MKKHLIGLTMVILIVAISLTATLISYKVTDIQQEATAQRLMETTELMLLQAQRLDPNELASLADTWGNEHGQYRITFIKRDGSILGDSNVVDATMENHNSRPEVAQAWATGYGSDQRLSATTGVPSLYAAVASEDKQFLVRVALPLHELDTMQAAVINRAIWVSLFAIALTWLLATQLIKRILNPLQRLQKATQSIATGNYAARVASEKHEIGALAQDFNQMADSLQESMERLQQQRFLLNTVLNHVVTGIIAIDPQGQLLLANPLARQLFRLPMGKPANTLDSNLLHRDPELWQLLDQTLRTGVGQEAELNRHRYYQVTTTLLPMKDAQATQGVIMAIHDMTHVKKLENLRTEFVANATHELRTPLTSIQGYIETLSNQKNLSPEVQSEIFSILEMESHRLSHLIDDMLTLSEIENRPQDINETICDLKEISEEVITLLQPMAQQHQVRLSLEVGEIPGFWARRDWLSRMLINLMDNAIKYNRPEGLVNLSLHAPTPERIQIVIEDTGIGISEEHLQRIFERFYRADHSRFRLTGSTGLGLAIVKHLVQLYGGTIQVTSVEGQGTRFVIDLPAEKRE
jgi:two-component system phosphate regulon sensor histidine kinase PhoR